VRSNIHSRIQSLSTEAETVSFDLENKIKILKEEVSKLNMVGNILKRGNNNHNRRKDDPKLEGGDGNED